MANNATAVYKLNLSAGSVSVGSTGLYDAVPHGQYVIIRQNRTLWIDGLAEVSAVRPSTALLIEDQPLTVYRVLSFTLVNAQTASRQSVNKKFPWAMELLASKINLRISFAVITPFTATIQSPSTRVRFAELVLKLNLFGINALWYYCSTITACVK